MEEWRDVIGYEGKYQVSNLGRVKSLNYNNTGKERILKLKTDKYGYLQVNLSKNGKAKMFKVHRLVAKAFIPNPNNLPQVNHKDENKTNNCVYNLEWCTSKYNNNYGSHNKSVHEKLIDGEHPRAKKVKCITTGEIFNTIKEAGKKYNMKNPWNISSCCKCKRKYAGKHPITGEKLIWEYV